MKRPNIFKRLPSHWLILLLITDLFFIFLLWLVNARYFYGVAVVMVCFTAVIIVLGAWYEQRKLKREQEAVESFFDEPNEATQQRLLTATGDFWKPEIENIAEQLNQQDQKIKHKNLELQNYQEYIEGWAHEIKTPLSLMTLVLANHEEEMSDYVYERMEHIRQTISGDIDQILYYARLQADHVDYKFEKINLHEMILEILTNFKAIKEEKQLSFETNLQPLQVISDRKVLVFIITQLMSNAVKYAPFENGMVYISLWQEAGEDGKIHLAIRDNGEGVPAEDLPFLFDKGFTGSHPDRQEATGMGLFLAQKYCQAISVDIFVEKDSISGQGFGIQLVFPKTDM